MVFSFWIHIIVFGSEEKLFASSWGLVVNGGETIHYKL